MTVATKTRKTTCDSLIHAQLVGDADQAVLDAGDGVRVRVHNRQDFSSATREPS